MKGCGYEKPKVRKGWKFLLAKIFVRPRANGILYLDDLKEMIPGGIIKMPEYQDQTFSTITHPNILDATFSTAQYGNYQARLMGDI